MSEAEDRTQAPSDRRLSRAREDGQAPLSREVVTFAGLAVAALIMSVAMPALSRDVARSLQAMLADAGASPAEALRDAATAWSKGALLVLGLTAITGAASVLLQTRFLVHGAALSPDIARLNPARGLKRILGGANLVEALKACGKLAILAWVLWKASGTTWPLLGGAMLWTPDRLLDQLGRELVHLLLLVLAAQALIAAFDLGWTRWRFHQKLRMSREDLKDEAKEMEGDPRLKARLRQLRQARARRRMVAAVAKATVVVTNPTHYAVALAYDRGKQAAPRVVAKGVDEMAARIREAARKAGVVLVANPSLARALYLVPLDAEVPAEHFRTVAEVIAYVWRLQRRPTE